MRALVRLVLLVPCHPMLEPLRARAVVVVVKETRLIPLVSSVTLVSSLLTMVNVNNVL